MPISLQKLRQSAKSAVLVACGLTSLARRRMEGGAVLTFHGLCQDGQSTGVLDASLHLPVSVFRAVCRHLKVSYQVMPLLEMTAAVQAGRPLPSRAVALSFDDGLASNYHLGFPVLRELGLPATIFLATGFLDGTHPLWFQEVDRALKARGADAAELATCLAHLKTLPDAVMRGEVRKLVEGCEAAEAEVARPMSWQQVREMQASGLVHFGGHTHTHPILSQCPVEQQAEEIRVCRDRMTKELGKAPSLFAYTNGGPGDFTPQTQELLAAHGFQAAFTMMPARLAAGLSAHALPRYGNPTSVLEAEATASGAFELVKQWRGGRR